MKKALVWAASVLMMPFYVVGVILTCVSAALALVVLSPFIAVYEWVVETVSHIKERYYEADELFAVTEEPKPAKKK